MQHEQKDRCDDRQSPRTCKYMKKYRSYRGEMGKAVPNLLARDFHEERPIQ